MFEYEEGVAHKVREISKAEYPVNLQGILKDIKYTYSLGGREIDPSQVIEVGDYTVIVEFVTDGDYIIRFKYRLGYAKFALLPLYYLIVACEFYSYFIPIFYVLCVYVALIPEYRRAEHFSASVRIIYFCKVWQAR